MKVLVFAPHPDDEILGCGGVMSKHIKKGDEVSVCIITSSLVEKAKKLNEEYAKKVHNTIGIANTFIWEYPTVELPHENIRRLTGSFNDLIQSYKPEVVYIPFYGDMHTDHYVVASSAMVALRPIVAPFVKAIYAYETLSETGWNFPSADKAFIPNVFSDISAFIDDKINAMKMYDTKIKEDPHPRSAEGILALAKYRGGTIGVNYAEAFMCIRSIM